MRDEDLTARTDELSRRSLFRLGGTVGIAAAGGALLAACGSSGDTGTAGSSQSTASSGGPGQSSTSAAVTSGSGSAAVSDVDLEAARKEGQLVIWHNEQEPDVVKFLSGFTEKTGIETTQLKIPPAEAVAKLKLEVPKGVSTVDILMAGQDTAYQVQQLDMFQQYSPANIDDYPAELRSDPAGYWTAFYLNLKGMVYIPSVVKPEDAPKQFEDILDPIWKDQLVFAGPASSSEYAFWYELRDLLPDDFFDKLAGQRPVAFDSSTAMIAELNNGNKKLTPNMSVFQLTKAKRSNLDLAVAYDSRGLVTTSSTVSIMKTTKRPNAAKAYTDYLLSEAGQRIWNVDITGSYSPLMRVAPPELPDRSEFKLLLPSDMEDFGDPANRAEFEKLWSRVVGLS